MSSNHNIIHDVHKDWAFQEPPINRFKYQHRLQNTYQPFSHFKELEDFHFEEWSKKRHGGAEGSVSSSQLQAPRLILSTVCTGILCTFSL